MVEALQAKGGMDHDDIQSIKPAKAFRCARKGTRTVPQTRRASKRRVQLTIRNPPTPSRLAQGWMARDFKAAQRLRNGAQPRVVPAGGTAGASPQERERDHERNRRMEHLILHETGAPPKPCLFFIGTGVEEEIQRRRQREDELQAMEHWVSASAGRVRS